MTNSQLVKHVRVEVGEIRNYDLRRSESKDDRLCYVRYLLYLIASDDMVTE